MPFGLCNVYKVIEVQGSTYAVEPIEGGPIRRVHQSNLRSYMNKAPVPAPRIQKPLVKDIPTPVLEMEMPSLDVECVLMEEVRCPREEPVLIPTLEVQEPQVVELSNRTGDQREEIDEASVSGFKSS